jgi:hypothetical protein
MEAEAPAAAGLPLALSAMDLRASRKFHWGSAKNRFRS